MKTVLFFLSGILLFFISNDEEKGISVEKALEQQIINLDIVSKGGHKEECIDMTIKNRLDKDTLISIESGRILKSVDTTIQDILIIRSNLQPLMAREEKKIPIYGFCCQVSNGGPYKKAKYKVGAMADENTVKLAKFLEQYEYPPSVQQSAVWVMSDNHDISSVHFKDKEKLRPLQKLLAKLKNVEIPWYTLEYKKDTAQLFSNRPKQLYAEIEYEVWNTSLMSMVLRNSKNQVIKRFFVKKPHNPNVYGYTIQLDVLLYPKGEYSLHIFSEEKEILMKKFRL